LAVVLALLDREPRTFSRTAARWGGRVMLERRLRLIDAQLTLAALAALPGHGARAGAEALIELSDRYGLRRVDDLLIACHLSDVFTRLSVSSRKERRSAVIPLVPI
jgi:hypothetical protein